MCTPIAFISHKEVMHLDRLYLMGFVAMDGPLGFLVYVVTILTVGAILYVCVEHPFLQMRERIFASCSSPARIRTRILFFSGRSFV